MKIGIVAAALAGLVIGCAPSADPAAPGEGEAKAEALKVGIVFDSGGLGDKSFNDSANRGIVRAEEEFGVSAIRIESQDEKDYADNLRSVADRGAGLVVAVGINMRSAMEEVAPEYPDTKFALIDAVVPGDNVRSILFTEEQGSYLAGFAAGLASKTGKIGFIGGEEIDLIKKFENGYAQGAKAANPDIVVLPGKYTGSWNNADKAKAAANLLYGEGADVIYHAAGRAGLGLIQAAKEQGKLAIGVDSDQDDLAPGSVLTSMIKRVDEAVYQTIKDIQDGGFAGGEKRYDLASGGVGLSEMKHTKDLLTADQMARLEEAKQGIISGELTVQ
jgi:basic membrane protein A